MAKSWKRCIIIVPITFIIIFILLLRNLNNVDNRMYVTMSTDKDQDTNCDLVNRFNHIPKKLQESMKSHRYMFESLAEFFKYFESELICPPSKPLNATNPPSVELQCNDSRYNLVFNGARANKTKHMIDLVIFGFDIHYLEIRLLEYYDIVDAIFLLEQDITFKGARKPFLLSQVLNSKRFLPFKDKIHYIQDHVENEFIEQYLNRTYHATQTRGRNKLKQYFLDNIASKWPLNTVYVLENDGDEIITRQALYHFKYCQDRNEFPVYAPSVVYKQNIDWLVATVDMLKMKGIPAKYNDTKGFIWRPAPSIWRADLIVDIPMRYHRGPYADKHATYHLGYGAANHFSNPGQPLLHIIKRFSTADAAPILFTDLFWTHLTNGNFTLEMLEYELFECTFKHVSELNDDSRNMLRKNLPWIVQMYPSRYPFLTAYNRHQQQQDWFHHKCQRKPF